MTDVDLRIQIARGVLSKYEKYFDTSLEQSYLTALEKKESSKKLELETNQPQNESTAPNGSQSTVATSKDSPPPSLASSIAIDSNHINAGKPPAFTNDNLSTTHSLGGDRSLSASFASTESLSNASPSLMGLGNSGLMDNHPSLSRHTAPSNLSSSLSSNNDAHHPFPMGPLPSNLENVLQQPSQPPQSSQNSQAFTASYSHVGPLTNSLSFPETQSFSQTYPLPSSQLNMSHGGNLHVSDSASHVAPLNI